MNLQQVSSIPFAVICRATPAIQSITLVFSTTMAAMTLRKIFTFFVLASLLSFTRADETIGGIQEEIEEALEEAYEQGKNLYDNLPPQGKFAVGAGVGLVGSRVAVKTAVSGVKVAGAAFIVYVSMFAIQNSIDQTRTILALTA